MSIVGSLVTSGVRALNKDTTIRQRILKIFQEPEFAATFPTTKKQQEAWINMLKSTHINTEEVLLQVIQDRPLTSMMEDYIILKLIDNKTKEDAEKQLKEYKIPEDRIPLLIDAHMEIQRIKSQGNPAETAEYRSKLIEALSDSTKQIIKNKIQTDGKEILETAKAVTQEITPEIIDYILTSQVTDEAVVHAVENAARPFFHQAAIFALWVGVLQIVVNRLKIENR